MKAVLSQEAYAMFRSQGYVRTGLILPEEMLEQVGVSYAGVPASSSNWSFFETNAIARSDHGSRKAWLKRALKNLVPWFGDGGRTSVLYEKTLYGSTEMLPLVLQHLLNGGLTSHLGEVPFLAAHDILLESTRDHHSFGFHDDGFGWDIFFQTGDDLTVYVALQDMDAATGGRLGVERSPEESVLFASRNRSVQDFAQFCREQGAPMKHGKVTREGAEKCRGRRRIADEFHRLYKERNLRTRVHYRDVRMSWIDMVRGEVILFNNKLFHDVEPWKMDSPRSVYVIRCLPLYDMGLWPPVDFLNRVACNRYLLDSEQGEVRPFDVERDQIPFVECPAS